MADTIEVEGRILPRPSGTRTRLPNNDVVYYESFDHYYLGEDWEFTGRIKYENNEGWSETSCYFEIVLVFVNPHWLIPGKWVTKSYVKWVPEGWLKIQKEYDTVTTIVDCA